MDEHDRIRSNEIIVGDPFLVAVFLEPGESTIRTPCWQVFAR
jgi:hypothetical protein